MRHKFYATRELNLAGKVIKGGESPVTIETDHDLDCIVRGIANGHLTLNRPADSAQAPKTDQAPNPK